MKPSTCRAVYCAISLSLSFLICGFIWFKHLLYLGEELRTCHLRHLKVSNLYLGFDD